MILSEFLAKKKLKAVFYGRYSTDSQTVETQQSMCYDFAKKYEMTIIHDYIDRNVSAFKKKLEQREEIDQLRKDARERKFDCVLVYKADRIARQISQHMQIWGEFRELGIPIIVTQSEKLYTTDSPNEILVEIGLSSLEAENTRVRTQDSYRYKTEKGQWLGGVLPYGYQYEDDEDGHKLITEVPIETDKVKEIFSLYKEGFGFQRVATKMAEEYPEDNWLDRKVKAIVTNPFYAGFTTSGRIASGSGTSINARKKWAMGKCDKIPPCIDIELWEECMELYEVKKKGVIHSSKYITSYLFKDILHCKECDVALRGKNYSSGKKNKKGIRYGGRKYICPLCKTKWDAMEVEEELIEEALSGWDYLYYSSENEEIQKKMMQEIQEDINKLDKSMKGFQIEYKKFESQVIEADKKQLQLMQENPEPDELQHALVQYRLSLKKKMDQIQREIDRKEKEKLRLQQSYGDGERFKNFIKDHTKLEYDFNTPRFRKLMLFLFGKIKITKDYKYELLAKVDLSQRGMIHIGFRK
jgi:site-specific DNA recombinase